MLGGLCEISNFTEMVLTGCFIEKVWHRSFVPLLPHTKAYRGGSPKWLFVYTNSHVHLCYYTYNIEYANLYIGVGMKFALRGPLLLTCMYMHTWFTDNLTKIILWVIITVTGEMVGGAMAPPAPPPFLHLCCTVTIYFTASFPLTPAGSCGLVFGWGHSFSILSLPTWFPANNMALENVPK